MNTQDSLPHAAGGWSIKPGFCFATCYDDMSKLGSQVRGNPTHRLVWGGGSKLTRAGLEPQGLVQLGGAIWEILPREGSQPSKLPGKTAFNLAWCQDPSVPVWGLRVQ